MRARRLLPILNLVGCLLLTGVILAQWLRERGLDQRIVTLTGEVDKARTLHEAEKTRASGLERDISQLKEAIESNAQARSEIEGKLTENEAKLAEKDQLTGQLQTELTTAREQVATWEAALKTRDERIRELDTKLAATRKRLDEAIEKLKAQ